MRSVTSQWFSVSVWVNRSNVMPSPRKDSRKLLW